MVLCAVLSLAGCDWTPGLIGAVVAGTTIGSVATIQRTPPDALYSLVTGRDCSVVRLDQGKTYCRAVEPLPPKPEFCTRSLGVVDCWQNPAGLPDHPPGVADGPTGLTAAQEANRVRSWP